MADCHGFTRMEPLVQVDRTYWEKRGTKDFGEVIPGSLRFWGLSRGVQNDASLD
jgi:hypothetical protein